MSLDAWRARWTGQARPEDRLLAYPDRDYGYYCVLNGAVISLPIYSSGQDSDPQYLVLPPESAFHGTLVILGGQYGAAWPPVLTLEGREDLKV